MRAPLPRRVLTLAPLVALALVGAPPSAAAQSTSGAAREALPASSARTTSPAPTDFAATPLFAPALRIAPRVSPHVTLPDALVHDGRLVSFARRVPTPDGASGVRAADGVRPASDATDAGEPPQPGLQNPSFSNDLVDWDVLVSGAGAAPGDVTVEDGRAVLREGDAFLVELSQAFVLPDGAATLSLELFVEPGFDLSDGFIPDAFEISLLDAATLAPVVEPWAAFASSAFNLQEDGTTHLGPSTTFDGQRIAFDVSGVPGGSELLLACDLIGADADTLGGVSLDDALIGFGCGGPGSAQSYGAGWPGTGGQVPTLELLGTPAPCAEITLLMGNPAGGDVPALLAMGFAQDALPTPFGGTLLVARPILLDFVLDAGGRVDPVTIPCDASLCGAELDLQVLAVDPGASAGWSFSAGLQILIGDA
ncbi:MAG: hypothetical protein H6825_00415 [Planctomycetes bacterium]|nr:hypothetical protein [Planctomycetota bacterium]